MVTKEVDCTIATLAAAHRRARRAVVDWLGREGMDGRLVTASMAPGWSDYETARDALNNAIEALGVTE